MLVINFSNKIISLFYFKFTKVSDKALVKKKINWLKWLVYLNKFFNNIKTIFQQKIRIFSYYIIIKYRNRQHLSSVNLTNTDHNDISV